MKQKTKAAKDKTYNVKYYVYLYIIENNVKKEIFHKSRSSDSSAG